MAEREARGEPQHLPVPGERGRCFQFGPHFRAAGPEVLCGTAPAKNSPKFPSISGSLTHAQIPGLHSVPLPRRDFGHPADLDTPGVHRGTDALEGTENYNKLSIK